MGNFKSKIQMPGPYPICGVGLEMVFNVLGDPHV